MNMLRIICVTISILILTSCASTHNIKEDGVNALGGGISVSEVNPGKFWIVAKTNFAAWENIEVAREMWKKSATKACMNGSFKEEKTKEYSYNQVPTLLNIVRYIISVKEGYALCENRPPNQDSTQAHPISSEPGR